MGCCNCSMFCSVLLFYVHSSFFNYLDGEERAGCGALLFLSSIVVWLFLTVPRVCLQFVIVVFPDHTRLLFLTL